MLVDEAKPAEFGKRVAVKIISRRLIKKVRVCSCAPAFCGAPLLSLEPVEQRSAATGALGKRGIERA